ncbi:peptidyl-tRNA hydrolase [Escherichia coli]|nr:peptidyl-tRNA hydrolase [Escherichia coli]
MEGGGTRGGEEGRRENNGGAWLLKLLEGRLRDPMGEEAKFFG